MPKTIQDLARLKPGEHPRIHALFMKAHAASWDVDRDLDWKLEVKKEDACVDPSWVPFGRTPAFQALSAEVKRSVARQSLGRMLHVLQLGESVAQDVCAKLVLICEEEEYRDHAAAQALDEARHHLALVRFMEKMGDEVEEINPLIEIAWNEILASSDKSFLITSAQFFSENVGAPLLDRLEEKAVHPLLKQIVSLIARDEVRHTAFGFFFVSELLRTSAPDSRYSFARYWLSRILQVAEDPYGPRALKLTKIALCKAGVTDSEAVGERMWEEHKFLSGEDRPEAVAGRRVHHLLAVSRRVGLLAPDILNELQLGDHPLILGALRAPVHAET